MRAERGADAVKPRPARTWVALAAALLCFGQRPGAAAVAEPPFTVVCSFYPMYVMALNVVGDTAGVTVKCLTQPSTGCLHDYQLAPADLKTLGSASVFVVNGAGMEVFLDKALRQFPKLKTIEASQGIELTPDRNPHVWLSVSRAMAQIRNLQRGLAAADPTHAAGYAAHAAAYLGKLEELRREMHAGLDGLAHRDIITFHEAFPYLADEFHLRIAGVIEREPGTAPSAGELAQTIRTIRQARVKALFAEPQYPAASAETIQRETGIRVSLLDPAVTGPRDPAQARDSYLQTMRTNLQALVAALRD